jgi:hypothetical protein
MNGIGSGIEKERRDPRVFFGPLPPSHPYQGLVTLVPAREITQFVENLNHGIPMRPVPDRGQVVQEGGGFMQKKRFSPEQVFYLIAFFSGLLTGNQ